MRHTSVMNVPGVGDMNAWGGEGGLLRAVPCLHVNGGGRLTDARLIHVDTSNDEDIHVGCWWVLAGVSPRSFVGVLRTEISLNDDRVNTDSRI